MTKGISIDLVMREQLSTATVAARAAELADADGFERLTLSAVARALGVQTPSLYNHVRDLAALHDEVTVVAMGELAAAIGESIQGRSGRDALAGFMDAHRQYVRAHPGRWQALQRRAGPSAVGTPAAAAVAGATRAMLRGYDLPAEDVVHATRVVAGALNGYLTLERIGSFDHSEPPADQSWPQLVAALDLVLSRWRDRDLGDAEAGA